jgi:hypothetical protein
VQGWDSNPDKPGGNTHKIPIFFILQVFIEKDFDNETNAVETRKHQGHNQRRYEDGIRYTYSEKIKPYICQTVATGILSWNKTNSANKT